MPSSTKTLFTTLFVCIVMIVAYLIYNQGKLQDIISRSADAIEENSKILHKWPTVTQVDHDPLSGKVPNTLLGITLGSQFNKAAELCGIKKVECTCPNGGRTENIKLTKDHKVPDRYDDCRCKGKCTKKKYKGLGIVEVLNEIGRLWFFNEPANRHISPDRVMEQFHLRPIYMASRYVPTYSTEATFYDGKTWLRVSFDAQTSGKGYYAFVSLQSEKDVKYKYMRIYEDDTLEWEKGPLEGYSIIDLGNIRIIAKKKDKKNKGGDEKGEIDKSR